ncbi:MAG: MarR family winged helix-turn-helix transcriptional regulator [Gemmatimonadaceae bacterium]
MPTPVQSQLAEVADLVCACGMVRRAARAVSHLYDDWLHEAGIDASQFAILVTLERLGPVSQAALGRRYDLDKTTVSRNLSTLGRRGWIRWSAGADARERLVSLTAAGRRKVRLATPAWRSAQRQMRASLGAKNWSEMRIVLKSITGAARVARRRSRA